MSKEVKRGEIYMVDLSPSVGAEQAGYQSVVVIQNNVGNKFAPTVIVAPISNGRKKPMPTHVSIPQVDPRHESINSSTVLLEQIRVLDKCRLSRYVGELAGNDMEQVDKAIKVSLGLIPRPVL